MTQNDIVLGLIAILTTLVTAWAYVAKRRADARAKRIEAQSSADLARVQAESQTMIIEAQTKAREVDTHAAQIADMMKLLTKQMEISTANAESDAQWRKRLEQNEARSDEGYSVIRAVQKETSAILVELVNAVKALIKDMTEAQVLQKKRQDELLSAIGAVPVQMQASNREELAAFAKVVGGELAVAFAEQLSLQQLSSDLFPFPDAEDPRWETAFIKPKEGVAATLQKQPFYKKDVFLTGPCAQIEPAGETVRIITNHLKGWYIVKKKTGAVDGGCWGWLAENRVTIIPPPEVAMPVARLEALP